MKIKHFAGYGFVEAEKVSYREYEKYGELLKEIVIRVTGDHEWGLEREDTYDVYHWLLVKFDKKVKPYSLTLIENLEIQDYFKEQPDHSFIEVADYIITYR